MFRLHFQAVRRFEKVQIRKTMYKIKKNAGYIAITTVVIISVVSTAIAVTIVFSGLSERFIVFEENQSQQLLLSLDGCTEEALLRLKKDPSYTGGTIPYLNINCAVSISGVGSTRTITATGSLNSVTRSLQSDIALGTNVSGNAESVTISTWSE